MSAHPVLSPGDKNKEVPRAKRLTVAHLKSLNKSAMAAAISVKVTTYGPAAVEGVKYLQKLHKLTADGIIGPRTWAMLESPVAPTTSVHKPSVQYNGVKKGHTHGPSSPMTIVLHDTESHDQAGIGDVKGVLDYLAGTADELNAHLVIDKEGNTGQGAPFNKMCYHARGGNTNSIGIEQIGFARFGFVGWWARKQQLDKVARWLAYLSKTYNIPLVHSTTHGVCMHKDLPAGGHSDPGAGYPIGRVLDMAIKYKRNGW